MPLDPRLAPFLRLQEVDSERYRLRKAIDASEARKEDPRRKVAQARNARASADAAKGAKERLLQDAQLRLKVEEERLQKLEKQILTLSSGREYKTMEHQIRGKKADKSLIEDEILGLLEEVEQARGAATAAKDALDAAEQALAAVDSAVAAATADSVGRLAVLDRQAAELEAACDRDLLSQYQRLLDRRQGSAIVPVVGRICQGCYTSITPHEENKALQGQIMTCGNCQRFIYLP
jgi:predicted  nucleic acid-binding Zn-ribbon protein